MLSPAETTFLLCFLSDPFVLSFIVIIFSNLYAQCGAYTHNPQIKWHAFLTEPDRHPVVCAFLIQFPLMVLLQYVA